MNIVFPVTDRLCRRSPAPGRTLSARACLKQYRLKRARYATLIGLAFLPWRADAAPAPPHYRITDLGGLDAGVIRVTAINIRGEVVVQAQTPRGKMHAFLWSHHRLCHLGTLGGDESTALGINDQGQIVGQADTKRKDKFKNFVSHGVIWQRGRVRDLGSFAAEAINNRGDVAGWMSGHFRAEAWPISESVGLGLMRGGRVRLLRVFGPDYNHVSSLNDSGDLIINHGASGGESTWIRRRGRFYSISPPACLDSAFPKINIHGQAVGRLQGDVVIWQDGKVKHLQSLLGDTPCAPHGMNDSGWVIGYDYSHPSRAILWCHGQVYGLSHLIPHGSGWSLVEADAINNRGQIAGVGKYRGKQHAFLLTPRSGDMREQHSKLHY